MTLPNTADRRQGVAPPFDLQRLREIRKQAEQAHAERQRRMDEVERLLRCHEAPPEDLFDWWASECASEGVDPVRRLHDLTRPLEKRCADLFSDYPEGSRSHEKPPDKLLAPYLKQWGAFDDSKRRPLVAELLTYLEDAQVEWRRHQWQVLGPTWAGFEWDRGEAVVSALTVAVEEALDYVGDLVGDDPVMDPRLSRTLPLLVELRSRLRRTMQSAWKRPWRKDLPRDPGRPRTGVDRNWATLVVRETRKRLERIHPFDRSREERAAYVRVMGSLTKRIVGCLGIRGVRDMPFPKVSSRPPTHSPAHELARRLCAALGVKRVRQPGPRGPYKKGRRKRSPKSP